MDLHHLLIYITTDKNHFQLNKRSYKQRTYDFVVSILNYFTLFQETQVHSWARIKTQDLYDKKSKTMAQHDLTKAQDTNPPG